MRQNIISVSPVVWTVIIVLPNARDEIIFGYEIVLLKHEPKIVPVKLDINPSRDRGKTCAIFFF